MLVYWSIFWRTFAQLAAPAVAAAATYDWVNGDKRTNAALLGFALLVAAVGGITAAGWSYVKSPASTVQEKALRSAAQAALGVLATLPVNAVADVVQWPALLLGGISVVVGAYLVTLFQNQGAVPVPTDAE